MALTIADVADSEDVFGKHRTLVSDITGDASYPAGGYPVTAADFGIRRIYGMKFIGGNAASGALLPHFDTTNSKIMFLYPTGGGAASPAALADPVGATGAVAVTSSAATLPFVPGRGKELAAATSLTTITVRAWILGE